MKGPGHGHPGPRPHGAAGSGAAVRRRCRLEPDCLERDLPQSGAGGAERRHRADQGDGDGVCDSTGGSETKRKLNRYMIGKEVPVRAMNHNAKKPHLAHTSGG